MGGSISYVTAIEILCSNCVIALLGALFVRIQKIDTEKISLITHITTSLSLPLMILRETRRNRLTFQIFQPLFVGLLSQVTIHLLLIPIVIFFVPAERFHYFMKLAISVVYSDVAYFGFPVIQTVFGDGFTYICAEHAVLLYAFVYPLHSIMFHFVEYRTAVCPDSEDEASIDEIDGVARDPNATRDVLIDVEEEEEEDRLAESRPPQRKLFLRFLTPSLIAFILGIIWSATGLGCPFGIDHFCSSYSKALMAPGIAAVGVHILSHGLRTAEFRELLLCLAFKLVGLPFIAVVWCYVLQLEVSTAWAVVLLHAMPMNLLGYDLALDRQWGRGTSTYTFVWSNMLALPVIMLWITVINEEGLLGA
jgi:predicted permease